MTKTFALKLASTLVLSLAAIGAAQAASAKDTHAGDKYGYEFRTSVPADKYGYDFRATDAYTDGARAGKFDPYTDGALVAGLDRSGVSATPARSFDAYTDGARSGKVDVFTEGANA
ncbi:hypothetical protein OR16_11718 [Cupriavidus basilensis OR16]|uniref:Copper resistance protein CopQ n=1 Tax=Cupriavidus basilensis OR16 TaxID=1127483 RepID=H1S3L5_9BURK|nr:hypothetical protein [Cupriavidus basilensis]EHP42916.1 hypothetical protein OR16_11718 [Cupriavidus basilensis OR16]